MLLYYRTKCVVETIVVFFSGHGRYKNVNKNN